MTSTTHRGSGSKFLPPAAGVFTYLLFLITFLVSRTSTNPLPISVGTSLTSIGTSARAGGVLAADQKSSGGSKFNVKNAIIASSIVGPVVIAGLVAGCVYRRRVRKKEEEEERIARGGNVDAVKKKKIWWRLMTDAEKEEKREREKREKVKEEKMRKREEARKRVEERWINGLREEQAKSGMLPGMKRMEKAEKTEMVER